jgi:hypothetical protein
VKPIPSADPAGVDLDVHGHHRVERFLQNLNMNMNGTLDILDPALAGFNPFDTVSCDRQPKPLNPLDPSQQPNRHKASP